MFGTDLQNVHTMILRHFISSLALPVNPRRLVPSRRLDWHAFALRQDKA
jgi:hypothetical protein